MASNVLEKETSMDDLHTLAVDVARHVLESESEDPAIRELARLLLEEARNYPEPRPIGPKPESGGAT